MHAEVEITIYRESITLYTYTYVYGKTTLIQPLLCVIIIDETQVGSKRHNNVAERLMWALWGSNLSTRY